MRTRIISRRNFMNAGALLLPAAFLCACGTASTEELLCHRWFLKGYSEDDIRDAREYGGTLRNSINEACIRVDGWKMYEIALSQDGSLIMMEFGAGTPSGPISGTWTLVDDRIYLERLDRWGEPHGDWFDFVVGTTSLTMTSDYSRTTEFARV